MEAPLEDLISSMIESTEAVEMVTKVSKGLKETLAKRLKVATTNIRVIMDEMDRKLKEKERAKGEANPELQRLKRENRRLHKVKEHHLP